MSRWLRNFDWDWLWFFGAFAALAVFLFFLFTEIPDVSHETIRKCHGLHALAVTGNEKAQVEYVTRDCAKWVPEGGQR